MHLWSHCLHVVPVLSWLLRSCELDSWSEGQLQRMVAGGNEAAKNFFAKKGWRGQMSKIEEKYHSRAAQLYKAHLDRVASSAKIPNSPERAVSDLRVPRVGSALFTSVGRADLVPCTVCSPSRSRC